MKMAKSSILQFLDDVSNHKKSWHTSTVLESIPEKGKRDTTKFTPTMKRFMAAEPAIFNLLIGGVQVGKTYGIFKHLLNYCLNLPVITEDNGKYYRNSKILIVRNTYAQLKDSSLPSAVEAIPEFIHYQLRKADNGYVITMVVPTSDKHNGKPITARISWQFKSFSIRSDENTRSINITAAFINEASAVDIDTIKDITSRTGRYPAPKDWLTRPKKVCFMDTNSFSPKHALYSWFFDEDYREKWAESEGRPIDELAKVYKYPDQLGPDAEYVEGVTRQDYLDLKALWRDNPSKVDAMIHNKLVTVTSGALIYSAFHREKNIIDYVPDPRFPLLIGADNGIHAAFVLFQVLPNNRLVIIDSFARNDRKKIPDQKLRMGFESIAPLASEYFRNKYYGWRWITGGIDPAAKGGQGQVSNKTIMDCVYTHFHHYGIPIEPAECKGNRPDLRFAAVNDMFRKSSTDGGKMLTVSSKEEYMIDVINSFQWEPAKVMESLDGDKKYSDKALKNWASHAADAIQYGVLAPGNHYDEIFNEYAKFGRPDRKFPSVYSVDSLGGNNTSSYRVDI